MKKYFKGFTLIECVVAMAILGIASLIIAQIYAAVSTRNKMNNLVNSSLTNQMAFVEKYTNADVVSLYFNNSSAQDTSATPPHKNTSASGPYVEIYSSYAIEDTAGSSGKVQNSYSYAADIYVLQSRTRDNQPLGAAGDSGYTEADYNLRYKYILGHPHS